MITDSRPHNCSSTDIGNFQGAIKQGSIERAMKKKLHNAIQLWYVRLTLNPAFISMVKHKSTPDVVALELVPIST